ncbi:YjgN family protein [Allosphingosinicella sp.]|jgi:uncharacterized membrane protein YjgN (DUF898 family)|uniref:YjgN family protein n=1 Tax=Allosphingosinicella sp. TaxID=2823234 RepID=UPI002EE4B2DD
MDGGIAPAGSSDEQASALGFTGRWREFLPIALTNLLLMVATLGLYRFWATTRERRYLWSRTRFIDDRLEWSGSGREMFLGFLIVLLLVIPMAILLIVAGGMTARGGSARTAGILLTIAVYGTFFYLTGVAVFRALRYRLSRTFWHGIRGGGEGGGWDFGWQYVWKTTAGYIIFALLVPWSKTSLWNDRWNKMSFGRHRFVASADADGLMGRWMAVYLVAIVLFFIVAGIISKFEQYGPYPPPDEAQRLAVTLALVFLGGYLAYSLVSLAFWSAFYRNIVENTTIGGLQFEFTARTMDWVKLILGHIGLVIVTLGVGLMFIRYRNWSFIVRHLEASGTVEVDDVLQSLSAAPGEAEGLADAFGIGGI